MQSVLDYPLVYTQHVAWGDMDAFGHVNMSCIIVMLKVRVWLILNIRVFYLRMY